MSLVVSSMSLSATSGNTIQKKRSNLKKRWCFTFNNYVNDDIVSLERMFKDKDVKYIFGEEIGDSGTPHLQGYIECPKRIRPIEFFKLDKKIHWESAIATKYNNIDYCSKDNKVYTNMIDKRYKGDDLPTEWSSSQEDALDYIQDSLNIINDREIVYCWGDFATGKTKMCKSLCFNQGAKLVYGTSRDALFSIDEQDNLICLNIPKNGNINWCLVEQLKDGLFYSTKYEGKMIVMNPPTVVIFTNINPEDLDKTDIDLNRLKIFEIMNKLENHL